MGRGGHRERKRRTVSARGRTDTQIVLDLLHEWHPMWLTVNELAALSPRHMTGRQLRTAVRDAHQTGHVQIDTDHTPARLYWLP